MPTIMKGRADFWAPGEWNATCDRCGRKRKSGDLQKTWNNLYVCREHWEPRHPQDFVKAVPQEPPIPWSRPDPADIFTFLKALNSLDKGGNVVLSNAYLTASNLFNQSVRTISTIPIGGDYYWEVRSGTNGRIGLADGTLSMTGTVLVAGAVVWDGVTGNVYVNGVSVGVNATYILSDTLGFRYNSSTGTLTFYKNNALQGVSATGLSGDKFILFSGIVAGMAATLNFGPTTFTPPSGASLL
jgi:hypothetical protein